jgi:hypothetical protein
MFSDMATLSVILRILDECATATPTRQLTPNSAPSMGTGVCCSCLLEVSGERGGTKIEGYDEDVLGDGLYGSSLWGTIRSSSTSVSLRDRRSSGLCLRGLLFFILPQSKEGFHRGG